MKLTSCKGEFCGNEADCLSWLEEMQPSFVSVEIGSMSESLDASIPWNQSLRSAVAELSDDIEGGEPDWQQYLTVDQIAEIVANSQDFAVMSDEKIEVGDRVESGDGDEHDTGRVDEISDGKATVSWDSLVVTTQPVSMLRKI